MFQTELPPLKWGNKEWEYSPEIHGWIIKTVDTANGPREIAVCQLLFHYRLVIQLPGSMFWEHGWCYSNPDDPQHDLMLAVLAALAWEPDEKAEPWDWFKRACHCIREINA